MENKRYWKSYEDLHNDPAFIKQAMAEDAKDVPVEDIMAEQETGFTTNRRDFLRFFGFGITAATLAACQRTPIKYALPYVNNPADLTPSVANLYASTYYDGQEALHMLVKTREGRPIKIEGNHESPMNRGGVNARTQASVLSLYDNSRLQAPLSRKAGQLTWDKADAEIMAGLEAATKAGKKVVVLTGTLISPSTQAAINDLLKKYAGSQHVQYDADSASAMLEANNKCFKKAALPTYRFDEADVIVGVNADFLGTWLQATEYTRGWAQGRRVSKEKKSMSRHYQFESTMTVSGANADYRAATKPSQVGAVLLNLYNALAAKAGKASYNAPKLELPGNMLTMAANDLWAARGKALVVCGSNEVDHQIICNAINELLESYGSTIDLGRALRTRQGMDADMAQLVKDMASGSVGALIVYRCNPAYSYHSPKAFTDALGKVGLKVSLGTHDDETGSLCDYVLPNHHYLEAWTDAEVYEGLFSIGQPTINPLFDTRQAQLGFLRWAGDKREWVDYIRATWQARFKTAKNFDELWNNTLHNGYLNTGAEGKVGKYDGSHTGAAANNVLQGYKADAGTELYLYQKVGIGVGSGSHNPWLQELPDPITRATWDNYVCVNKLDAQQQGLKDGDMVTLSVAGQEDLKLPVCVLPGVARGVVAVALGYGRSMGDKDKTVVGARAAHLGRVVGSSSLGYNVGVTLKATGEQYVLARTQNHQTIMGRDIVKETVLSEYVKNPYAGNTNKHELLKHKNGEYISLWARHDKQGHYWSMAIDMNACTGCGACVVSCQAENNIAVVGRDEVRRGREMHWLRIDRYFSTDIKKTADEATIGELQAMEDPSEQPEVVFQPMLCQHCDNAPCENVCPVLATTHSSEGLNQMTYNRCFGTKYCANNCPYKVRRFNWFDYANSNQIFANDTFVYNPAQAELGRMVLNPDVTVRSRGVMEKCSFCVQRLQAAKLEAKKEGRALRDGDATTACAQSCPAGAIIFGDLNDPNSRIAQLYNTERSYHVIEEVKTLPHVSYMTKVRNKEAQPENAKA